ncbi:MAG: hypothetical protein NXI10_05705, partial [bacterium]|nr:hypothetical protein [bacterium]
MLNIPSWNTDFTNHRVSNTVQLGINPEVIQTSDYQGDIEVRVTYETWNGSGFTSTTVDRTLTVSYDHSNPTNLVEDLSTFVFQDAHFIKVEILTIGSNLNTADLFIESTVEVERYYSFDGSTVAFASYQFASNNEFVEVFWDVIEGAEFYELEWVHINDYTLTSGVYEPQTNLSYNFYKNSTRINTRNNWYRIPNIFDHGYVIFRVRGVGYQGTNFEDRYDGTWSSPESGLVSNIPFFHKIPVTEFDADMNWSHSSGYVENGKRFESIGYSDGLGRGRQSLSRNTVTDQVIVNNVYYDEIGRPVINDLSTPVDGNDMSHRIKFNTPADAPTSEFTPDKFNSSVVIGACGIESNAFWQGSGSGQYYSTSNPILTEENGFIPDANGYSYNRVTYMNDYTGRVLRISGFGDDLKLGSGHETRFVYPSTNQTELNELFGSEVGYSKHYEKQITIDPNGQVYVRYTDMARRVVASYMMGPNPDQLDPLPNGQGGTLETVDMINSGENNITSAPPSSTIIYTDYIAADGTITVDYAFTPQQYQSICLPANICFDCVYDLTLTVRDECGAVIDNETVQINGQTFNEICDGSTNYSYQKELTITAGEYIFEKTLTVNQEALEQYWCAYIENSTCLDPVNMFFNDRYLSTAFEDCYAVEDQLLGDCDILKEILIEDVTPGGQYALYDVNNQVFSASDPTSIFYGNAYQSYSYTDGVNPILVYNPNTGTNVSPSTLTIEEFVQLYDPSWGQSLAEQHHPEYCYIEFCGGQTSSDAFDQNMLDEYNFGYSGGGAYAYGYFNPLNNAGNSGVAAFLGAPFTPDPFFHSGGQGVAYNSAMQNLMENFITIDNGGTGITLTMWEYAVYLALNCTPANALTCIATFDPEAPCSPNDLVWVNFRQFYLEAKSNFVYQAENDYAISNGCENECIGADAQGCSSPNYYSNKTPRFTNLNVNVTTNASIQDILNNASPGIYGQQVADNMIADACQDAAEAYADNWIAQLSGCDFSGAGINMTDLRNDFIALLVHDCNLQHPYTSSTSSSPVSISTGANVSSIDEILASHFGTPNYQDNLCTPYLISEPAPYQTSEETASEFVKPLDQCACDRVYEAYELTLSSSLNLEEALAQLTGVSLEDAHHIICACDRVTLGYDNWATQGYTWPQNANTTLAGLNVSLPVDLVCESYDCSVSCEVIDQDLIMLEEEFASVANFENAVNYEVIVTNYLNQTYGYTLSYEHYQEFLAKCDATELEPYCSLNPLMEEWVDVMTLVAFRGQLMNDNTNQVDLNADNIVYEQSELFENFFSDDNYWSSLTGTTLTLHYGNSQSNCTIDLTAPTGFNFDNIVKFGSILPRTNDCNDNSLFDLEVFYWDCGQLVSTYFTGESNCFDIVECICDPSGILLCDEPLEFQEEPCYEPELSMLYSDAIESYGLQIEDAWLAFQEEYNEQCAAAFSTEQYSYDGFKNRYQYTLYYYDQAGNLVNTVAPEGVNKLTGQDAAINTARNSVVDATSTGAVLPTHDYITSYEFNSYDQLVKTTNPDQDGDTRFWYDYYGRIVASQNPVQLSNNQYTYSLYDVHGRPVETGIAQTTNSLDLVDIRQDDKGAAFINWVNGSTRSEVTITKYDRSLSTAIAAKFENGVQSHLRLRVSSVLYFETFSISTVIETDYQSATHYSYDSHGNVVEQLQDVPMLAPVDQDVKSTRYEFELISGNVDKVKYQEGERDNMVHEYLYDELNRIEEVFTTSDNVHKSREAHYYYYDYGPLARVETGQNKVQGSDFAYTINGWMKALNASTLSPQRDMGKDGVGGFQGGNNAVHEWVAKDVNAYTIGYFEGDYNPIGGSSFEISSSPSDPFALGTIDLYNGNISNLVTSIHGMTTMGSAYRYDQLNRLTEMTAYYNTNTNNTWTGMGSTQEYYNAYSYDKNGNITNLQRNGTTTSGLLMDNFTYTYVGLDGLVNSSSSSKSNRLDYVDDSGLDDGTVLPGVGDIKSGMLAGNYEYDEIGQLTEDVDEDRRYEWRSGDKKILRISPVSGSTNPTVIEFVYNPFGQRVLKIVKPTIGSTQDQWQYTYYTYGANGQVMGVYEVNMSVSENIATLSEHHIYGMTRLGISNPGQIVYDNGQILPGQGDVYQNELGLKRFECANHLGNVQVVITDRKTWNSTEMLYEAAVIMTSDYYPFGMVMPERNTAVAGAGSYRFGYNGMEVDNEVSGNGNSYTTQFRQYDPRLGRWKSLDPLMAKYPDMSPYTAFNNNPVFFVDPQGLEGVNNSKPKPFRKR